MKHGLSSKIPQRQEDKGRGLTKSRKRRRAQHHRLGLIDVDKQHLLWMPLEKKRTESSVYGAARHSLSWALHQLHSSWSCSWSLLVDHHPMHDARCHGVPKEILHYLEWLHGCICTSIHLYSYMYSNGNTRKSST